MYRGMVYQHKYHLIRGFITYEYEIFISVIPTWRLCMSSNIFSRLLGIYILYIRPSCHTFTTITSLISLIFGFDFFLS